MVGARETADSARAQVRTALADGKRRNGRRPRPAAGQHAVLALQRKAGNAAVSALMSAKRKSPSDQAVSDIDGALREMRSDDPAIDTVETGLKAAKSAGVPVDLEGTKPPASALEVTKTGFGPESVPAKKTVPAKKAVPAANPLGKAAAKGSGAGKGKPKAGAAKAVAPGAAAAKKAPAAPAAPGAAGTAAASLGAEQLLQPPVPPTPVRPEEDPQFVGVTQGVAGVAKGKKAHPSASSKAKEAQKAAVAPPDDMATQAKAAKVDTMDAQQPGSFDKKAFIAAVKAAIEAKSPKTLKEADEFKKSGKAEEVKGEVQGLVTQGKADQSADITTATEAPPDQSTAVAKPVAPMSPEQAGPPGTVAGTGAVPKPAPAEQVNLAAGKHQVNQEMAEADVTDQQLAESKEPEFEQAAADKKEAATHADTAPAEYRAQEQQVIDQGKADATAQTADALAGMQSSQVAALAGLAADKEATKTKDEQKRAEVTEKIQGIYAATEADVRTILDGIDPKVEKAFGKGEKQARNLFERYVKIRMTAYKLDRYSGMLGGLRWAKDKLLGMPAKVNEFFEAGRELYLKQMDTVISAVADIIGTDLTKAKKRIATGKADIAAYVKSLPSDLQKVGSQASAQINEKFGALESDVNSKQDALVNTLASKYVESRKGLDGRIEALQAENKGLVDKVVGKIKGIIKTIRELGEMLRKAFARASGAVGQILKAPGKFLDNLIAGVKGGITRFKDNILDHLRKGLLGWLFGALAQGGIELPKTFDLKGILGLLASIFGLTWANIRKRVVRRVGEKAMGAVEKGVEVFQVMASEGIGGLWRMFVEKIGDIKEMIVEQAKDFVVTQIIKAGITWLIGLLNPAAAFIKACKLIYDIVMFFVNNARRIAQFVVTIIDSIVDIVRGNVSGVIAKIESALSQMVPIIIGFLASILGISGIADKIRQIVKSLQRPVNKALDFIIKKGLKLAGPFIRGVKGISQRVRARVEAGRAWARRRTQSAAAAVKGRLARRPSDDDRRKIASAVGEADALLQEPGASRASVTHRLPELRRRHGLSRATLLTEPDGDARILVQRSKAKTPPRRIAESALARAQIQRRVRQEANRLLLEDREVQRLVEVIREDREKRLGNAPEAPRESRGKLAEASHLIKHGKPPGLETILSPRTGVVVTEQQLPFSRQPSHTVVRGLGKYQPGITNLLREIIKRRRVTSAQIAVALRKLAADQLPDPPLNEMPDIQYLAALARLETVESARSPSQVITGVAAKEVTIHEPSATAVEMVTTRNPPSIPGGTSAARGASAAVGAEHKSSAKSTGKPADVQEFLTREINTLADYVVSHFNSKGEDPTEREVDYFVREELIERLRDQARREGIAT